MDLGTHYSMDSAYFRLVEEVKKRGARLSPRGQKTIELRPASFTLQSPYTSLYTGMSRNLNLRFLAIETMSYIAGWYGPVHAELMIAANANTRLFINPELHEFDGAYGKALRFGLTDVVRELARDPDSRRAVAAIWAPQTLLDLGDSADIPCTVALQFVRTADLKLGLVVTMRSNDLNWGTPYDVAAFGAIQMAVAKCLGWRPGWYRHQVGSLHLYEASPPEVKSPEDENFEIDVAWPPYAELAPVEPVAEWTRIKGVANTLLNDCYRLRVTGGNPWHDLPQQADPDAELWAKMIRRNRRRR